jgi:hypothetical protein
MLATLQPETQFLHDVLEGVAINPHGSQNCHDRYEAFVRGFLNVDAEFKLTANVISGLSVESRSRPLWWTRITTELGSTSGFASMTIAAIRRNAMTFLELQLAKYKSIAITTRSSTFSNSLSVASPNATRRSLRR